MVTRDSRGELGAPGGGAAGGNAGNAAGPRAPGKRVRWNAQRHDVAAAAVDGGGEDAASAGLGL